MNDAAGKRDQVSGAACLSTLRKIKDAAFATVDEKGQPQVRIIDVMLVEDEKLFFVTARGKDFYSELINTKMAAVTVLTENFEMIRLNGKVEKLGEEKKWIDKIFEANPVMNDVYPGESRYILEPFCIEQAEIEYFDLSSEPVYREQFSIGGAPIKGKGYLITDGCISCGKCAEACPQKCIIKDGNEPYHINQENCLHCGLCRELCPQDAVIRKGGAL